MSDWLVRAERVQDEAAIATLTAAAFEGHLHSDGSEPAIVARLRSGGDLTMSLIAEQAGHIIGHAAFSPVAISDGARGWFGLGPVSVCPRHQRCGVGSALIREGLAQLGAGGAAGCVVFGSPAYYGRFGFRCDPALVYPSPLPDHFQALLLSGPAARGEVRYADAFG